MAKRKGGVNAAKSGKGKMKGGGMMKLMKSLGGMKGLPKMPF